MLSILKFFDIVITVIAILAETMRVVWLVGMFTLESPLVVASVVVAGVTHEFCPVLSRHVRTSTNVDKILE